jgi:hypothetical protein
MKIGSSFMWLGSGAPPGIWSTQHKARWFRVPVTASVIATVLGQHPTRLAKNLPNLIYPRDLKRFKKAMLTRLKPSSPKGLRQFRQKA